MNQSLYHIRAEHLEIIDAIEQNEGELTPEIEMALSLTEEQFQEKAISYGWVIKKFDDNDSIIDAEIKRLTALKKSNENKQIRFKDALSGAMLQFGVEKIETPTLKLSFRKSESVEIFDEKEIPTEYVDEKIVHTISKIRIKEDLKKGLVVKGANLLTKQNLQIK